MKPKINPYATLLQPGIRGKANPEAQKQESVLNTAAISITVITGELLPGVWDYGYRINREGSQTISKLPGEGQGWFRSKLDATLYGLGHLHLLFDLGSPEQAAIYKAIARHTQQPLF